MPPPQGWSARILEKHLSNSILLTHQMWPDFEKWLVGCEFGRMGMRAGKGLQKRLPSVGHSRNWYFPETYALFWVFLSNYFRVITVCRNFFLVGKMVFIF